jgi:L-aminopeptidase/D-esterase-like protein
VGQTGCTVVLLPQEGAVASVDVRGAAPGTRETDLLRPENTVERVHALCLSGGSAFGLAAADGVMGYLASKRIGFAVGPAIIPIVPAAVVFDLGALAGAHPDADAGRHACVDAEPGSPCGNGRFGAGTGATVGKLLGPNLAVPSGVGTASRVLPGGGTIGALAVVNAFGNVLAADGSLLAGAEGEPTAPRMNGNTTLAVVATDVGLTKTQAHRLAIVSHDGFAQAIRPVHTSYDGDTVFAVSTGVAEEDTLVLEMAAVAVVALAIRNAVRV